MHYHRSCRAAFTLIELSIVIVIIGLLVGGILVGQTLIRSSEVNAVVSESNRYLTAIGAFREKYFTIPGDMSNASSFWSGAGNGDGDGKIENHGTAANNEVSLFWIHLGNSGLIEGTYTNTGGVSLTAGTHVPQAKIGGAWNVAYLGTIADDGTNGNVSGATNPAQATFYDSTYGNVIMLGPTSGTAVLPASGTGTLTGLLATYEASGIDVKLDDGAPDTGTIMTLESQGETDATLGCGNQDTATTPLAASSYQLSNTSPQACSLVFKTGY